MGQPGKYCEIVAELFEWFQVGRQRVVAPGLLRIQIRGVQTESGAYNHHPAFAWSARGRPDRRAGLRHHGVQKRQGKERARAP
jgi:hypothetical protein